jgi:hypothetical protein
MRELALKLNERRKRTGEGTSTGTGGVALSPTPTSGVSANTQLFLSHSTRQPPTAEMTLNLYERRFSQVRHMILSGFYSHSLLFGCV